MGLPGIPDEKLPTCWSDDVRMNALFAPFRIKTANPESWDMKMKFWSDMLRQWCKCKKNPIVSAADAKFAFQRKGRTPACIEIVVEEMFRNGDLSPMSKYQQILYNGPEGWVRWGARLAFKPAALAIFAVSSFLPGRQSLDSDGLPKASIDSTQRFILESAVKEQAIELLNNYPNNRDRLGTIDELMKNCSWQQGRETFEVLLGYLVSQGAAVKKDDVVKLADPDRKVSPVTETDEALVKLISAERRLEAELTKLSKDAALAEVDARAALQIGNKLAAKNHLRKKHKAIQRMEKCEATLENVRQLLHQTKDADVTAAIVDTYKTTSQAMKKGMKDNGLTEDAVHDTMDDLKEVLDSYNEIDEALSAAPVDYDAAELEQELKDLLAFGKDSSPITPKPQRKEKKVSERDFVFDGEARVLAELNELDIESTSPKEKDGERRVKGKERVPVTESWEAAESPKTSRPSQPWYPPSSQVLRLEEAWNNNLQSLDESLDKLAGNFGELRTDDRLHPGQPLNVDFSSPPRLYNTEFEVKDHKYEGGVWLYSKDSLTPSTEYFSSESPGKTGGSFQMAPGGERKKQGEWPQEKSVEDLERRLRNLRGFNL
ncbi:hypothetical protein ACJJTC_002588 [Scirpophaga incertulas]